jgi:hypothetical protein
MRRDYIRNNLYFPVRILFHLFGKNASHRKQSGGVRISGSCDSLKPFFDSVDKPGIVLGNYVRYTVGLFDFIGAVPRQREVCVQNIGSVETLQYFFKALFRREYRQNLRDMRYRPAGTAYRNTCTPSLIYSEKPGFLFLLNERMSNSRTAA